LIETFDEKSSNAWKAEVFEHDRDYLHGRWWALKRPAVQGVASFFRHDSGEVLKGHFIGRDPDGDDARIGSGQWIMVVDDDKKEQRISEAKKWLVEHVPPFRSDSDVGPIRRKYHSYHLTQMGAEHL